MRKVKIIDIGNMSHKEVKKVINKYRIKAGLKPIGNYNWITWCFTTIIFSVYFNILILHWIN